MQAEQEYAQSIVETVREPLVILDGDLRVISASGAFYRTFEMTREETEAQHVYDLGNRQCDIPELRGLLEDILPNRTTFDDYEVKHDFKTIGQRKMVLSARRLEQGVGKTPKILLAFEVITTARNQTQAG